MLAKNNQIEQNRWKLGSNWKKNIKTKM